MTAEATAEEAFNEQCIYVIRIASAFKGWRGGAKRPFRSIA